MQLQFKMDTVHLTQITVLPRGGGVLVFQGLRLRVEPVESLCLSRATTE